MLQNTSTHTNIINKNNNYTIEKEVMSRCHGSKIFGSQQTVVLQIWQKKTEKLTCMTFPCTLALRNKTVASPYFVLPSTGRLIKWPSLLRKTVEILKFCYHGNVTSHFSLLSLQALCSQPFTWYKTAALESKSSTGTRQTKKITISNHVCLVPVRRLLSSVAVL